MTQGDNLEKLHELFCASMEVGKRVKIGESVLGLTAAVLAIGGIVLDASFEWKPYLPLFAVLVAVMSIVCRYQASKLRSYGEACKRLARRSYGLGRPPPRKVSSDLIDDVPWLVERQVKRNDILTVAQYYGNDFPPGTRRLLEMYAQSAYFSSRLLRVLSRFFFAVAMVVFVAAFVAFYSVAIELSEDPKLLDTAFRTICSVVFILIVFVFLERGVDAWSAASEIRSVEDRLLQLRLDEADELDLMALAQDYDAVLVSAPFIPTSLYQWRRDKLNHGWSERRKVLG